MATYEHEIYWTQIKELAEKRNYSEIERLILKLEDQKEQVALFRFAVRGLMFREWSQKNLIPIVQLGDKAIEIALQIGETDEANIICYNMSANLAGCWNDGFKRELKHFEKGLDYANRALEFRKQLNKGPTPFSLAYWAKGIHLYNLQNLAGAEENFNLSLKSAIEAAVAAAMPINISKDSPFAVLIAYGYVALAQLAQKKPEAQAMFEAVIVSFEEMKGVSEDAKADAEIGLDQLRFVRSQLL